MSADVREATANIPGCGPDESNYLSYTVTVTFLVTKTKIITFR